MTTAIITPPVGETKITAPPLIETAQRQEDRMAELKSSIAQRHYSVDAGLVAEEILRKLRLVRSARRELERGPGRTPGRPAAHH